MNWINAFPLAGFLLLIILISGRFVFLKKRGIRVGSGGKKTSRKTYFLYFLFLLILLLWLFELIKAAFSLSFFILPEMAVMPLITMPLLKLPGAFFILSSLIILLLALLHFKDSLRFGLDQNNQGKLITDGIFSMSRNPFFLSLDLYFLGTALTLPNPFFIGFALIAVVSIHFFILKEEKFMQNVHGNKYAKYTRHVRRYF